MFFPGLTDNVCAICFVEFFGLRPPRFTRNRSQDVAHSVSIFSSWKSSVINLTSRRSIFIVPVLRS